jgi:hypothetical protein
MIIEQRGHADDVVVVRETHHGGIQRSYGGAFVRGNTCPFVFQKSRFAAFPSSFISPKNTKARSR